MTNTMMNTANWYPTRFCPAFTKLCVEILELVGRMLHLDEEMQIQVWQIL